MNALLATSIVNMDWMATMIEQYLEQSLSIALHTNSYPLTCLAAPSIFFLCTVHPIPIFSLIAGNREKDCRNYSLWSQTMDNCEEDCYNYSLRSTDKSLYHRQQTIAKISETTEIAKKIAAVIPFHHRQLLWKILAQLFPYFLNININRNRC